MKEFNRVFPTKKILFNVLSIFVLTAVSLGAIVLVLKYPFNTINAQTTPSVYWKVEKDASNILNFNFVNGTTTSPAAMVLGNNPSVVVGLGSMPAGTSGLALGYGITYNGVAMTNSAYFQAESQGTGYRNILLNPIGGNIGIGTTAPTTPLHITTNNTANAFATFQSTVGGLPGSSYVGQTRSGYNNLLVMGNGAYIEGAPQMAFSSGNRIGINKANPSVQLHIKQTVNQQFNGGLIVERSDTNNIFNMFIGSDNKLYFFSGSGGYVTIDTAGNIGTTGSTTLQQISSKELKENFVELNQQEILSKIDQLPVKQWNYNSQSVSTKHIGPFAEDFYSTFGLGQDEKVINPSDEVGVALVGIKALSEKIKTQEKQIDQLQQQLELLQQEIKELKK